MHPVIDPRLYNEVERCDRKTLNKNVSRWMERICPARKRDFPYTQGNATEWWPATVAYNKPSSLRATAVKTLAVHLLLYARSSEHVADLKKYCTPASEEEYAPLSRIFEVATKLTSAPMSLRDEQVTCPTIDPDDLPQSRAWSTDLRTLALPDVPTAQNFESAWSTFASESVSAGVLNSGTRPTVQAPCTTELITDSVHGAAVPKRRLHERTGPEVHPQHGEATVASSYIVHKSKHDLGTYQLNVTLRRPVSGDFAWAEQFLKPVAETLLGATDLRNCPLRVTKETQDYGIAVVLRRHVPNGAGGLADTSESEHATIQRVKQVILDLA